MLDPTIDARNPGVLEIDSDAVEAVEMELFLEKLCDLTILPRVVLLIRSNSIVNDLK